jgi:hypothetical protein
VTVLAGALGMGMRLLSSKVALPTYATQIERSVLNGMTGTNSARKCAVDCPVLGYGTPVEKPDVKKNPGRCYLIAAPEG